MVSVRRRMKWGRAFYMPGAPFLLSALLTIGCIVVFMQTPRPVRARAT